MDTFGYVVLEAMAHGLPVIAPGHLALNELIGDDSGLRFAPENMLYGDDGLANYPFTMPMPPDLRRGAARTERGLRGRIAEALTRLAHDDALYDRLAAGALARVQRLDGRTAATSSRGSTAPRSADTCRTRRSSRRARTACGGAGTRSRRRRPRTRASSSPSNHAATSQRVVHAVRVEVHARPSDREREQQLAARREHPLELRRGLARAQRVERVAVAPEPDVLGHVQAADRLQRAVCERHVEDAAGDRRQALDVDLQRPDVDEGDLRSPPSGSPRGRPASRRPRAGPGAARRSAAPPTTSWWK